MRKYYSDFGSEIHRTDQSNNRSWRAAGSRALPSVGLAGLLFAGSSGPRAMALGAIVGDGFLFMVEASGPVHMLG